MRRRVPTTNARIRRRFVTPRPRGARTHIANGLKLFWEGGHVTSWYGASLCGRSYRMPSFTDHVPMGHEPCLTCERRDDERNARSRPD